MVLNNRVVGPNKSVMVGKINDRAALYHSFASHDMYIEGEKKKCTNGFKSRGNILGQSATKC